MTLEWTKKSAKVFDLQRSDGVVLARCFAEHDHVSAFVYNAVKPPAMRLVCRELFTYMEEAMSWCGAQLLAQPHNAA